MSDDGAAFRAAIGSFVTAVEDADARAARLVTQLMPAHEIGWRAHEKVGGDCSGGAGGVGADVAGGVSVADAASVCRRHGRWQGPVWRAGAQWEYALRRDDVW